MMFMLRFDARYDDVYGDVYVDVYEMMVHLIWIDGSQRVQPFLLHQADQPDLIIG